MRHLTIGALLFLPWMAACTQESVASVPTCINKAAVTDLSYAGWLEVNPAFLVEVDMVNPAPVAAAFQNAEPCDLVAIDVTLDGREIPNWLSDGTFLKSTNPDQAELVQKLTITYVKRNEGGIFNSETRLRHFFILNSARPGTIELWLWHTTAFEREPDLLASIAIEPKPDAP